MVNTRMPVRNCWVSMFFKNSQWKIKHRPCLWLNEVYHECYISLLCNWCPWICCERYIFNFEDSTQRLHSFKVLVGHLTGAFLFKQLTILWKESFWQPKLVDMNESSILGSFLPTHCHQLFPCKDTDLCSICKPEISAFSFDHWLVLSFIIISNVVLLPLRMLF